MIDLTQPLKLLANWGCASERWWYDLPGREGLGCYGTGYNHWGLHTNLKYVAAMATLATHAQAPAGVDRAWALRRALAALRFTLANHRSAEGEPGAITCTDGSRWGHTWITALAVERMMHVMPALEPHLADADCAALRRVLTSEAGWLCHHHRKGRHEGVFADPWNHTGKNVPESNIWDGCLLWRTAERYPDHPDAEAWREQAHRFLLNGVSVAADADDDRPVAGRPLRDWHAGENFFPHYALDHHGYLNVGYMAICHSNAAMLHFDLKALGHARPESLDHHQRDLWQLMRRLIFADGRLARIGGDSRVRYAYCQEFLVPSLLYAAERLDEPDARALLRGQLDLIQREADYSADGSFYSRRLERLIAASPYYYTRLESDRACVLSQLVTYVPLVEPAQPQRDTGHEASVAGGWHEPAHGAVMHRCPTRLASFSWRAHTITQAMCQPPDDGHLCDWQFNLTGRIRFLGDDDTITSGRSPHREPVACHVQPFGGGFVTAGRVREGMHVVIKEGWQGNDLADHHLAFAALPDGHTVVGLQYARVLDKRAYAAEVRGLGLNVINDLYNDHARKLTTAKGSRTLKSPPPSDITEPIRGLWANVDDRLGVVGLYGARKLTLQRFAEPLAGSVPELRSLHVEQLNWHCQTVTQAFDPGAVMLDVGWAALSSVDAAGTRGFAGDHVEQVVQVAEGEGVLRGVVVSGLDGQRYLVLANFGPADVEPEPATLRLPEGEWAALDERETDGPAPALRLPAGEARVWRWRDTA